MGCLVADGLLDFPVAVIHGWFNFFHPLETDIIVFLGETVCWSGTINGG